MKTVKEMNDWFKKLENALYVWGMNGDIISDSTIQSAYDAYHTAKYDQEYYNSKLAAGRGRIGADCSGAFAKMAGSDNTAAGYYAGCISKGTIATIPNKACMVFKRNSSGSIYHIGWYDPDTRMVAEMASSTINFRRLLLTGNGWSNWGIPKFVDYTEAPEMVVKYGWTQEDGGWRYYLGQDSCIRNDWYQDQASGKWYWFDGAGMMVANTWYRYHDRWYFLGSDGAMVAGQFQKSSGKWYYLDESGAMATQPITLTPDQDGALQLPGLAE